MTWSKPFALLPGSQPDAIHRQPHVFPSVNTYGMFTNK